MSESKPSCLGWEERGLQPISAALDGWRGACRPRPTALDGDGTQTAASALGPSKSNAGVPIKMVSRPSLRTAALGDEYRGNTFWESRNHSREKHNTSSFLSWQLQFANQE